MPDVANQLRAYFDEVTERTTEEDVRLRATTTRGVPTPPVRFRPRPLAAGAMGFGLAMTLLGVVLVMNRLFGGTPDVGGNGATGFEGDASPWITVPVLAGVGLLAAGVLATLRNTRTKQRGGRTMETIEREEQAQPVDDLQRQRLKKRNRMLGWLSGILAVAVIGLGAWLIAEVSSGDGASLPADVEAALDNYIATWNEADGAAFMAATTPDYTFLSNGDEFSRSEQAASVLMADALGFTVENPDGVSLVAGEGPYYVARTARVHTPAAPPEGYPGESIFTIGLHEGTWKVEQHTWVGDF